MTNDIKKIEIENLQETNETELIKTLISNLEDLKTYNNTLQKENDEKDLSIQEYEKVMTQADELISELETELNLSKKNEAEIREEIEREKISETLKEAQRFAKEIKDNAQKEAEAEKNKIIEKATKDAEQILNKAKRNAVLEEEKAVKSHEIFKESMTGLVDMRDKINEFVSKNEHNSVKIKEEISKPVSKKGRPKKNEEIIEILDTPAKEVFQEKEIKVKTSADIALDKLNGKLKKHKK